MEELKFRVYGPIKGQPRPRAYKRNGHIAMYDPKHAVDYKGAVVNSCIEAIEEKGIQYPIGIRNKGFDVLIDACFKIPKSFNKKQQALASCNELRPNKKPDADNIAKIICDSLNDVLWYDDSQVTTMTVRKKYTLELEHVDVVVRWNR